MNEDMEAIRVMGFWHWLWCRTGCYRRFMRWAHLYNWHHCTVMGPFTDGSVHHWCQWCGLRYEGTTRLQAFGAPISVPQKGAGAS